ncbi:sensor histidine kinase N-terminal domain-containing protein [Cupriavidus basilensis]
MKVPSLRLQLSPWLPPLLLMLLALDTWITYHRAMDAAHVAFDRTLEASLKSMREGIRPGLPIVCEIARAHGATVTLEQTPGGGLTVSVRFAPGAAASAAT